ncbi:MAG: hemolysin family protein [bacterium]
MAVFIYLSGWFSSTETALTHLNAIQLVEMREQKVKNFKYILKLKKDIDHTLVAVLVGNNVVNIALSSISALIANELFQRIGISIVVGLVTFLLIIAGEIIPKSTALMNSKRVAISRARQVYYFIKIIGPIVDLSMLVSNIVLKAIGYKMRKIKLHVSDEAIKGLASLGQEQGMIKKIEKDIIHQVFCFGDKKVADIMVPIKKVFSVKPGGMIKPIRDQIVEHGFTRVPVIDDKKDVIGILYGKDLMAKKNGPIEDIMRKPFKVYSNEDITDVFDSMELRRVHMAVVKDQKTSRQIGIVTLEDILEELVGEIHDEYTHLQEE